jgi:MSHA pilin protein MshC
MKHCQPTINERGFSLIELITVIVLIGILAVSVGSRFVGTDGFAEFSYQSRLISSLRAMQTKAMFDTRPATVANPSGYCYQINFSQAPAAFGPPSLNYAAADGSATCSTTINFTSAHHLATTNSEMADNKVSFLSLSDGSSTIDYIGFDSLGRPLTDVANCNTVCKVEFRGEQSTAVCIAAQGFIYACY